MRQRLLIGILLLTLFSTAGYGQRQFQRQYQKPLKSSLETNSTLGKYYLGITGGVPYYWMSMNRLHDTDVKGRIGYQAGIAGERFIKGFSIGIYATLTQRGTTWHNSRPYEISLTENGTVDRKMVIRYDVATLRTPVSYYLNRIFHTKKLSPYLFLAPEVEFPVGIFSSPYLETTYIIDEDSEVNKETIHPNMNVCAVGGIGLLYNASAVGSSILIKFDLGMNLGLMNQASAALAESGVFLRSQGVEANITLLFRLKKPLRDAGYYFSRSGYN